MVCDSIELRYRKTKYRNCSILAAHYIVVGSFTNFRNFYICNVFADRYLDPILTGLLNIRQNRGGGGGGLFYPPPNSLVFTLEA